MDASFFSKYDHENKQCRLYEKQALLMVSESWGPTGPPSFAFRAILPSGELVAFNDLEGRYDDSRKAYTPKVHIQTIRKLTLDELQEVKSFITDRHLLGTTFEENVMDDWSADVFLNINGKHAEILGHERVFWATWGLIGKLKHKAKRS